MNKISKLLLIPVALFATTGASAQIYVKLNCLYAVVGVVNPQIEFVAAPHSTISLDATFSPWRSVNGHHMQFGMFTGEYRYYFRQATQGWYLSANAGLTGFDISKPQLFENDKFFSFKGGYSKGFGVMLGIGVGYSHRFRERWVVDVFVAVDWFRSWYNGYFKNGEINMNPHGHEDYRYPDPFNGSSEFLPSKIGVSIGYCIFNPKNHKRNK